MAGAWPRQGRGRRGPNQRGLPAGPVVSTRPWSAVGGPDNGLAASRCRRRHRRRRGVARRRRRLSAVGARGVGGPERHGRPVCRHIRRGARPAVHAGLPLRRALQVGPADWPAFCHGCRTAAAAVFAPSLAPGPAAPPSFAASPPCCPAALPPSCFPWTAPSAVACLAAWFLLALCSPAPALVRAAAAALAACSGRVGRWAWPGSAPCCPALAHPGSPRLLTLRRRRAGGAGMAGARGWACTCGLLAAGPPEHARPAHARPHAAGVCQLCRRAPAAVAAGRGAWV